MSHRSALLPAAPLLAAVMLSPLLLLGGPLAGDALGTTEPSLLAHWKFQGSLLDSSGNGHDGQALGMPRFAYDPAACRSFVQFGGDSLMYVDAPEVFTPTGDWSVAFWKRSTAGDPAGRNMMIINARELHDHEGGLGVWTDVADKVWAVVYRQNHHNLYAVSTVPGDLDWHHVVATYEAATRATTLYVDGVEVSRATTSPMIVSPYPLVIGGDIALDGSLRFRSRADLADLRFYQGALSPSQVADIMLASGDDGVGPEITVTGLPTELWPPNHELRRIEPDVVVTDACDDAPTVTLQITSSEPDEGTGDGDTDGDVVVHSPAAFDLRAERSGGGEGRTYTLTWRATDSAGNVTCKTATVVVPRSSAAKR